MWNNDWIKGENYPSWGDTEVYKKQLLEVIYFKENRLKMHIGEYLMQ